MLSCTVVGKGTTIKKGEYNGRAYEHRKLYVSYADPDTLGERVEVFNVKPGVSDLAAFSPGDKCALDFDRYGRLAAVYTV